MVGSPGRGRAATLALMGEMIAQNAARAPGQRNANQIEGRGRGLADNYPTPGMGRVRARNPGPHSFSEPPLCPPYTQPQCLCRDPLETLHSFPENLDSSDSGLPFFESIMDLKPQSQVMSPQIQPQIQTKKTHVLCSVKLPK